MYLELSKLVIYSKDAKDDAVRRGRSLRPALSYLLPACFPPVRPWPFGVDISRACPDCFFALPLRVPVPVPIPMPHRLLPLCCCARAFASLPPFRVALAGDALALLTAAQAREMTRQVLYLVIEQCLRLAAPFMPFVTEELWQRLSHRPDQVLRADRRRPILPFAPLCSDRRRRRRQLQCLRFPS